MTSKTGTELFLVDNSDADWKVLRYGLTEEEIRIVEGSFAMVKAGQGDAS